MKKVRAHLTIRGIVQGVSFRAYTVETARKHGTTGWVKNNSDGSVEAIIEGDEADVKHVIDWCHTGPSLARVDNVLVQWEEYKNEFDDFIALTRWNNY